MSLLCSKNWSVKGPLGGSVAEHLTVGFSSHHDLVRGGMESHAGLHAQRGVCLETLSLDSSPQLLSLTFSLKQINKSFLKNWSMIDYFLQLSLNSVYLIFNFQNNYIRCSCFSLFQPVELFIAQKHTTFSSAFLVCSLHVSPPSFGVNLTLSLRLKSKCKSGFAFIMPTFLISLFY